MKKFHKCTQCGKIWDDDAYEDAINLKEVMCYDDEDKHICDQVFLESAGQDNDEGRIIVLKILQG